jgi:hypothetical protein
MSRPNKHAQMAFARDVKALAEAIYAIHLLLNTSCGRSEFSLSPPSNMPGSREEFHHAFVMPREVSTLAAKNQ